MTKTLPVLTLFLLAVGAATGDDWPQWRGPNRTGVSKETGLLKEWPNGGPKLLWDVKGAGRGYADVSVSKGKLYTLGDALSTANDKDQYVTCFDDKGTQLWKTKIGPPWESGQPNYYGSRSTPTVDGDRLYVISPQGVLVCLETASGEEKWREDLKKDFGGGKGDGWGYSESPLIDGERVVCTPGREMNTMVALDKVSGAKIWSCSSKGDSGAGHSSIVISEVGGTRVYVQTTASGALAVNAKDGKLLWTYKIDRTTAVIPTPIIRGDYVFFSAGYGRGGALLQQVPGQNGDVAVKEVYGLKTALNNRHGGVVLFGDRLFGDTDHSGAVFCAEFMTGNILWKGRSAQGKQSASVIAADGLLYIRYANGIMTVADGNGTDLKELGSFKIPGSGARPSWSHPVIANGRLYLREQDSVLCYDISTASNK